MLEEGKMRGTGILDLPKASSDNLSQQDFRRGFFYTSPREVFNLKFLRNLRSTFSSWYDKKMRATPELSDETDRIESWLHKIKNIAIVGISRNQHKDSYYVGRYLQNAGYNIFPVNPGAEQILGIDAYSDLKSIPVQIDAVDIFIKPEYVTEVVDQALDINPKVIWLQLGVGNHPNEIERAKKAGVMMVQNRCMKVDHQFLIRDKSE